MPGVPTNRGCDACRKQKKKCDGAQPACGRCVRSRRPCIGMGRRRYMFKDQSFAVENSKAVATRSPPNVVLSSIPTNAEATVAGEMVSLLKVTDPGFDISCYGAVLTELPKRLGHNPALDASVSALTSATRYGPSQQMPFESLKKYGAAINAVQQCLADPALAYTPETLCSVYLLYISHGWMARKGDKSPSHSIGMLHLMQYLLTTDLKDDFLIDVALTVAGSLISESIFDPSIALDTWIDKIASIQSTTVLPKPITARKGNTHVKFYLRAAEYGKLAVVSQLMRHPYDNIEQLQQTYGDLLGEYEQLVRFADSAIAPVSNGQKASLLDIRAQTIYHQARGLLIAICLAFNTFLQSSHLADEALDRERDSLCADAVTLGEEAKVGRPLAALEIPFSTSAALLATRDDAQKTALTQLLDDYDGCLAMRLWSQQIARWKDGPPQLRDLPWFRPGPDTDRADVSHPLDLGMGKGETNDAGPSKWENCCIL